MLKCTLPYARKWGYNPTDNIISGNEEGTCTLIDVEILGEINVVEKGNEKVLKQ